ncbi:hypothetical protein N0V93_007960 [Gnomoniopsis smithogilvyi]|uniref:Uncharacterized protein n=1 Tax=Gnomoniopsis smithogilvyi TaxID=1191159 RepID=A0A9W8YKU1_9PEZI|nr:hypothetical protein N0V93_007960 [Gnomoniopsis smithogilvyi]
MGSPSKERAQPDLPPSGPPPVFSLASSEARKQSKENVSPATENTRSQWFRKPDTQRESRSPGEEPPQPGPNDVEVGGEVAADPDKNSICGCSKANFIIILFFMIVLLAAAVGGGVGGSLFASKRSIGPA